MRGCLGWLLLMPLVFAFWLVVTVGNACGKRGGLWRMLGILVSLVIGGICVQVGYWFAIEGFVEWEGLEVHQVTYPVLGWISMIGGGLIAILGTWTSLAATKEELDLEERVDKEMRKVEGDHEKRARQVPRVQQDVTCPGCGSPNALGQRFCVSCGSRLTAACPRCGAIVEASSRFCANCGAGLV